MHFIPENYQISLIYFIDKYYNSALHLALLSTRLLLFLFLVPSVTKCPTVQKKFKARIVVVVVIIIIRNVRQLTTHKRKDMQL